MAIDIQGKKEDGGVANLSFNKNSKVLVDAEINETSHFISLNDGLTFNIVSHDATAAAGTYILYFKNTSTTRNFFVELIRVSAVETSLFKVWSVTGTAAGGNALTPVNLNLKSGISAEATARGDDSITGLTAVSEIAFKRVVANTDGDIPFQDTLILGTDDAIAVEIDTDDGTPSIADALIRGYYKKF